MPQFLLDTDQLTLFHHGHPSVAQHLAGHAPGDVGLAAVTVEECLRGRLAALANAQDATARIPRSAQLLDSVQLLQQFPLVPFDQAAENQYQDLRSKRLWVGSQDLKIAAIALANKLILVTRNHKDFGRIPGLKLEDWSV